MYMQYLEFVRTHFLCVFSAYVMRYSMSRYSTRRVMAAGCNDSVPGVKDHLSVVLTPVCRGYISTDSKVACANSTTHLPSKIIPAIDCVVSEGRRQLFVHADTHLGGRRSQLQLHPRAEDVPSRRHRTTGENHDSKEREPCEYIS